MAFLQNIPELAVYSLVAFAASYTVWDGMGETPVKGACLPVSSAKFVLFTTFNIGSFFPI